MSFVINNPNATSSQLNRIYLQFMRQYPGGSVPFTMSPPFN